MKLPERVPLLRRLFPTRAYTMLAVLDALGIAMLVGGLQKGNKALIVVGITLSLPFLVVVPFLITRKLKNHNH